MNAAFEFEDRDTFLHRLHPTYKMVWVLMTLAIVMVPYVPGPQDFLALGIWLVFGLTAWGIGQVSVRRFLGLLRILLYTFAFLIVIQALTYRYGSVLFSIFSLPVREGGVLFGILLSVRVLAAMSVIPVFVATTSPGKLMSALMRLRVPATFVLTFVSALTFTGMIFEMWESIVDAQRLRGFDIRELGIWQRAQRGYIPVLIPLILMLFRRGNDLDIALGTKGFGTNPRPTEIEVLSIGRTEITFAVLLVVLAALYLAAITGRIAV